MELNLIKTTSAELHSGARCILALKNEPFFFIRFRGSLYINKEMKGVRKITQAIATMWKYDFMETQEIMDEVDAAYDVIRQTAGELAARQLWNEWNGAAKESRKKKAVAKAREWIADTMENMTDEAWDDICAAGYDSDLVSDGFWRAYSDLHNENKDHPKYRDWSDNARKAAFVYGYQLGMATAAKAEQEATA